MSVFNKEDAFAQNARGLRQTGLSSEEKEMIPRSGRRPSQHLTFWEKRSADWILFKGRWSPPVPTTTGGTAMPSIEEARGQIMTAHRSGESVQAQLAQAKSELEDAANGARQAIDGTNQSEGDQVNAQFAAAGDKIEEAQQLVAQALAELEGVGQRL